MNVLERYFAPARGALRESLGIAAFFEPADTDLYRRLLPAPFTVPDQPLVSVSAIDYLKAAPWPLTRWQEWSVMLRCKWRDSIGWYPVTAPVTRWLPMSAGRYLGYPKYVVDSILVTPSSALAMHRGVQQLAMHFEPNDAPSAEWAADLLADDALFKSDIYVVVPPGTGATAQRVSYSYVEAHWTTVAGTVRLAVDARQPWAKLMPGAGAVPGQASHFVGGINLVAEKLPRL
jgi:Acetoacetate decarboxylase (ADC)